MRITSRRTRPGRSRRVFEPLEPRLLLAGDVLISELMAVNNHTLADRFGEYSDWIELHNTSSSPVDLGGWHLTDSSKNLAKWTFPEGASIDGGAHLVVFASDRNLAIAGEEYHTNFKLTSDGEYLALVDDAGRVVHEYKPEFPRQYADVSYGVSSISTSRTFVDVDTPFSYRVPTGPSEDAAWRDRGFDDAAWAAGAGYLGYETSPDLYASILETIVPANTTSAYLRWTFEVASPAEVAALTLRVKYDDGFVAYLNGARIAADREPATLAWNSSATSVHADTAALVYSDFSVTNPASRLVPGANVLAIHGLNCATNLSDFLIGVELRATLVSSAPAELRYFPTPTPREPNGEGVVGFAAEPVFSQAHGFFGPDEDFFLSMTTETPGAAIYYTLDGSIPSPGNPSRWLFNPASPPRVEGTSVVRAAAYKQDHQPSPVATQTYLFLDDVIRQTGTPAGWPSGSINGQVLDYGMDPDVVNDPRWGPQLIEALRSIPTFSIVTDLDNLFDPATGIYVNAAQQTPEFERPLSLELINPDGTEGFQIEAGMRIRGNFSASGANPKHAFRLFFREEYGDARLEYPLFGDAGVSVFEKLDLRCDQNDSWAFVGSSQLTYVHDVFSRDNQGLMGQPYTRSTYCHLYLNGVYWGLYQTEERPDDYYGESYFGGDEGDYDVIKSTGGPAYAIEATDGNMDAWTSLFEQLDAGVASDAAYYRVQGLNPDGTRNPNYPVLLDVDNLIDYMIDIFYNGDEDRGLSLPLGNNRPNNFFAIRNRNGEQGFQFFSHDAEQSLLSHYNVGGLYCDRTGPFTGSNQHVLQYSNPQWFHQALMANESYRREFGDRVHQYFFNGGLFTPEAVTERFLARAAQIDTAIIAESARWGDAKRSTPLTKADWQNALEVLCRDYFPYRTGIVLNQLRADGLYPSVAAPTFSQHGGDVPYGYPLTVTNEQGAGLTYVTLDGADPRDVAQASQSALVAANAPMFVLVPHGDVGTGWTGDGTPLDLSGWQSGRGGVGFDNDGVFRPYVGVDLESQMHYLQTTVYVHVPFTVTQGQIDALEDLFLTVRADAGYIVYLNGVQIASRYAPASPGWRSASTGEVSDAAAVAGVRIDVSSYIALLRPGANVLAIHGMNQSTLDADFLVSAELGPRESNPYLYAGNPIALTATTTVKARTLLGGQWSALAVATFTVEPAAPVVLDRRVLYRGSAFGETSLAMDKTPLLPGETAGFANYTSYVRGINAITVDVAHLCENGIVPAAGDFTFRLGNSNDPDTWAAAPTPRSVTVGPGQGVDGSDRVTLIWADNAIENTWFEVTLKAAAFGLESDDRFYWGSAIGETGDSTQNALVNATDLLRIRDNASAIATIDNRYDVNKDGAVDSLDAAAVLGHFSSPLGALRLITVPGALPLAVGNEGRASEDTGQGTEGEDDPRFVGPRPLAGAGLAPRRLAPLRAAPAAEADGPPSQEPRQAAQVPGVAQPLAAEPPRARELASARDMALAGEHRRWDRVYGPIAWAYELERARGPARRSRDLRAHEQAVDLLLAAE